MALNLWSLPSKSQDCRSVLDFFFFRNIIFRLGLLIYAHHLSTQEAETRELQVQCQPGLHTSKA